MTEHQIMKVNVLMSTYNGESFLCEQIDSILAQKNVKVTLSVRDDGSTDSTQSILQDYGDKLSWYQDQNMGPARSFLDLLSHSEEADLYAFSDQDDFWQEDKLAVAANSLADYEDIPVLYCSRTQLTDAELQPTSVVETNPLLTFGESLVYEFVPGCTMVFNKRLRDIVNRYTPDYLPMHDVWIYCVALAIGAKVVFDKQPHILYRQHGNNTIGQGNSTWHEWKRRWKRLTQGEHSRHRRACELLNGYSEILSKEHVSMLQKFTDNSISGRLKLLADNRFRCSDKRTWRMFKIAIMLNTY